MENKYDIIIVGGGPAALCFLSVLSGGELKVAVVEKQDEAAIATPVYDGREIALTHFSQAIMKDLGIWQQLASKDISLIVAAEVKNGDSPHVLRFDAHHRGIPNLGFIVSNQAIRRAAYATARKVKGVDWFMSLEVRSITTDSSGGAVMLNDGSILHGDLIVAADSRFSSVRDMMGIKTEIHDLKRTCIVCTAKTEKSHENTATELFLYGQTLAILPLNDNRVSLVVTCSKDKTDEIMHSPEELSANLTKKTQGLLGRLSIDSRLYSYPLVITYAQKFYARRFALLGDAAVGMHPVTAHGFNLGLKGAYTLANEIRHLVSLGLNAGHVQGLLNYDHTHQQACRLLYLGTNLLVDLYTAENKTARFLRHGLLRLGSRLTFARNRIISQLTDTQ